MVYQDRDAVPGLAVADYQPSLMIAKITPGHADFGMQDVSIHGVVKFHGFWPLEFHAEISQYAVDWHHLDPMLRCSSVRGDACYDVRWHDDEVCLVGACQVQPARACILHRKLHPVGVRDRHGSGHENRSYLAVVQIRILLE